MSVTNLIGRKAWIWPEKTDNKDDTIVSPDGRILQVRTSCGDLISRQELEFIFQRGYNPLVVPVVGEISFWNRGLKLVRKVWRSKHCHKFPKEFDPFAFIRGLGLSERETNEELHDAGVALRMKNAMVEARVWTTAVTNAQGSLMFLASKLMNSVACSEFYLVAIEAIVNNRIRKATQLEALINIIESVDSGKLDWSDIVSEHAEPRFDELPHFFYEKHLTILIYNIVVYLANLWKDNFDENLSMEDPSLVPFLSHVPTNLEIELASQIFANYYHPRIYKHLQIVAECIGRGVVTKEHHVFTIIDYLTPLSSKQEVKFVEILPALLYGEI